MPRNDEKDREATPDETINAHHSTPAEIERAKDKWHTDGGASFRELLDAEPTDESTPPPAK